MLISQIINGDYFCYVVYCDLDVNHLVVIFKWYLRTLCVFLDNLGR